MHVKQSWLPLTTAMCGLYVAKSFQLLTLRLSMLCCDRLVLEGTRVLCVMHLIHIIWEVDSEVDSEIDSEVDSEAGSDVVDLHFCYCIHCICSPLVKPSGHVCVSVCCCHNLLPALLNTVHSVTYWTSYVISRCSLADRGSVPSNWEFLWPAWNSLSNKQRSL